MEIFEFNELFFEVVGLYVLNIALIIRLCLKMNFLAIVVWPIIIYGIGPYLSYAYLYAPVLSRYIFPENFLEETALFTAFLVTLLFLDKFFDIGGTIKSYVLGRDVFEIGSSRLMTFFFYGSGFVSALFQIVLMATYGSILTGSYTGSAVPSDASGEQAISWGMLGGLYELFFSCTIVIFISKIDRSLLSKETLFYSSVLLLRLIGGTRLILIKELSVLLFIMVAQKKIKMFSVGIVAACVLVAGTLVGLARSGGAEQEFGALSALAYESSLTALTLNIADNLSHDQNAYQFYHPADAVLNITSSLVPTFIRRVFVPEKKDREINMATEAGFDTDSPVGAMELFASSVYIFYNPWIAPFLFPIILLFITKIKFNRKIKSYVLISIFIESLNFWRDPFEISLKIIVQTVVFYYFVGMDWKSLIRQSTRGEDTAPARISRVIG